MKNADFRHIIVTALLAASSAAPAFGQYVWLNEKGVKQYSDMPPPPSVPQKRILKQPAEASPLPASDEKPIPTDQRNMPAAKPPMTIAEKNADFRKRRTDQLEKEKKAADESKLAAEKRKNCERARSYHNLLDSGERIARTDRNGERSFLTDEQREQELGDVNRLLQECK